MLKLTIVIAAITFVIFLVTAFCSAHPMNNETVDNNISEVKEAPKYHIRIHINYINDEDETAFCFGALVHKNYIVAPNFNCLGLSKNKEVTIVIYAARKEFNDISNPVTPTKIKPSTKYDIGVIYVEAGIENTEKISLRVIGKRHHLHSSRPVEIYGFNKHPYRINYNVMNVDKMITTKRKGMNSCFHTIYDYSLLVASVSTVTAMDLGSPIVYTNRKKEERLVALARYSNSICALPKVIVEGIELNQPGIADELINLSDGNIHFRK